LLEELGRQAAAAGDTGAEREHRAAAEEAQRSAELLQARLMHGSGPVHR
jgi:hypothetical protein